ncbi:competence/damage-inducible protein A [Natroniella sulfidigena]|uniref:competence/damage-inducible protein A n=1 Tax=Natroniella sulfidigena TaxID=723921 RepID=UPI00200A48F7|nr:competence/damage-inducible protein A [Natroniella sulfidigena]MCK8817769.1 competence/damage-inducible protein A [Natroniella sulfidigena]
MKAEIIAIGTELLLGQIVDTNSQWLAQQLARIGIDLYYKQTVGDNKDRIVDILQQSLKRANLVIITGGLGPTQDDLTREAIAEALDVELVKDEQLVTEIEDLFAERGYQLTENNFKQAYLPVGAEAINNPHGTAPGVLVEQKGKIIVALPGVPQEMKAMIKEVIIPYLQENILDDEIIKSKVMKLYGIGESSLEEEIADILEEQTNPTIAPLASQGEVKLRLTAKADSVAEAEQMIAEKIAELEERIGEYVYGYDEEGLEEAVAKSLLEQGLTLATAESCTGGLLGTRLTDVSGSSAYFERGVISYSNQAKQELLGVAEETLKEYGAVSSQTAQEMALGIKKRARTDLGLAITGIAGPTGGTPDKPVGLVYIAVADKEGVASYKYQFKGSRERIKFLTSQQALKLLLESSDI